MIYSFFVCYILLSQNTSSSYFFFFPSIGTEKKGEMSEGKKKYFCTHHFFSHPTHFNTLKHQHIYLFFNIQCRFPSTRSLHPLTPNTPHSKPTLTLSSTAGVVWGPGGRIVPHTHPPLPIRRHTPASHTHTVSACCHPLFFPTHIPLPMAYSHTPTDQSDVDIRGRPRTHTQWGGVGCDDTYGGDGPRTVGGPTEA